MNLLAVMQRLWTRATGVVDGADAELKVSLPTVRGWVTTGKKPRVVWEELSRGAWVVRPLYRIDWQAAAQLREVINTRGWSTRPEVATIRFTFDRGLVVKLKDGREIQHVDG